MQLIRRRFGLIALLGFQIAAVVTLHRLGDIDWLQISWSGVGTYLEITPVEDVLGAVLRQIGLVLAYWMLGTTVLYLGAYATRLPVALRSIEWATLPAVRRIVDGAVAVGIATASITTPVVPALAESPPPVVVEADESGQPIPPGSPADRTAQADTGPGSGEPTILPAGVSRVGWTPTPAGSEPDVGRPVGDAVRLIRDRVRPHQSSDGATAVGAVVVEPGDHLWSISRRHLEDAFGDSVPDEVVAQYWRRVIDANRSHLRSGDPDLIYPAETVLLPPIDPENQ
jgi:nucleoid-associated protein YgaU